MRSLIMILLAVCLVLTNSCQKKETIIATVGTSRLTKKQLSAQIPEGVRMTKENINALLDKWVNTELLYQEAVRRKLDRNETLQIQIKQLTKEVVVNNLLENEMAKISVSRNEIFDYFTKHREEFLYEVKISRIVLSDESLAYRTLSAIKSGANFSALAQDLSQDRVLEKGTESKYFSRGVGDPRAGGDPLLEEAIFSLNPGEISNVIKSQEGYQIVKLVDRKKVKKDITLSEVEDYINSVLQYKKSREMLDALIKDLKSRITITQNADAFLK